MIIPSPWWLLAPPFAFAATIGACIIAWGDERPGMPIFTTPYTGNVVVPTMPAPGCYVIRLTPGQTLEFLRPAPCEDNTP